MKAAVWIVLVACGLLSQVVLVLGSFPLFLVFAAIAGFCAIQLGVMEESER